MALIFAPPDPDTALDPGTDIIPFDPVSSGTAPAGPDPYRTYSLDRRLRANDSAANDALNVYRRAALTALGDYGSQSGQNGAADAYDTYRNTLESHRDQAIASVSPAVLPLLQPRLDQAHEEHLQDGQSYRIGQHRQMLDLGSLGTLAADLHDAHYWSHDPFRLDLAVARGDGEWRKIGQRNGWSAQETNRRASEWNGHLFGAAIASQFDSGNVPGARIVLAQAAGQVDPATYARLAAVTDAGANYIAAKDSGDDIAGGGAAGTPPGGDIGPIASGDGDHPSTIPASGSTAASPPSPAAPPAPASTVSASDIEAVVNSKPYVAPTFRYFGAEIGQGFHQWVGRGLDEIALPPSAIQQLDAEKTKRLYGLVLNGERKPDQIASFPWPIDVRQGFASYLAALPEDQRKAKQAEIEQALRGMGVEFLTEEEWNNDPELKRAMPFEPFMTRERARAKADLFDAMQDRIYQIGHAPDDPFIRAAGKTLGFVSDPTNIVPLGMAGKQIFNIARIGIPSVLRAIGSGELANVVKTQGGRIALDALKTGAAVSAKTAASESLTKPWRERWGEEVPWSQIGIDSLMAGFTGFGLGMMGGFGSRIARAPAGGDSGGGGSAAVPPRKPGTASAASSSSGQPSPGGQSPGSVGQPGVTAGAKPSTDLPPGAPRRPLPSPTPPLPGWGSPAAAWKRAIDPAYHVDFADQMKAFQSAGLIKTEADVAKFAAAYKPDTILLPMPSTSTKSPGQFLWRADKGSEVRSADGTRSFQATAIDAGQNRSQRRVAGLANEIEKNHPNEVVCVHCFIIDLNNPLLRKEVDIVTRKYVIEESSSASGLAEQLDRAVSVSGLPGIGYSRNMGHAEKSIAGKGHTPIKNRQDLLDKFK